jgi:hypothetical protein
MIDDAMDAAGAAAAAGAGAPAPASGAPPASVSHRFLRLRSRGLSSPPAAASPPASPPAAGAASVGGAAASGASRFTPTSCVELSSAMPGCKGCPVCIFGGRVLAMGDDGGKGGLSLAPQLDLMSAEQWKGLFICLLYAGTSTAISMVNKVGGRARRG